MVRSGVASRLLIRESVGGEQLLMSRPIHVMIRHR
jgi:hypothetical protein